MYQNVQHVVQYCFGFVCWFIFLDTFRCPAAGQYFENTPTISGSPIIS